VLGAQGPCELQSVELARLDHRDVNPGVLDGGATAGDRHVAETADDELEERPDVVVGLTDQDACHLPRIDRPRRV